MVLKVCVNGGRTSGVPMTPRAYAVDVLRCFARGAGAVHVHPRDADGRESLDPEVIGAAVRAIRETCPELPVGVSTGAWIEPDPALRVEAVRRWTVLPDFASVNVHEDGAEAVAAALYEHGVGVEAGIWTVDAARRWLRWRTPTLRVLLECMEGSAAEALANAHAMLEFVLGSAWPQARVVLHGEGPATWEVFRRAVALRLDTRIGLEDTLVLPDGTPAPDNAALVDAAVALGAR